LQCTLRRSCQTHCCGWLSGHCVKKQLRLGWVVSEDAWLTTFASPERWDKTNYQLDTTKLVVRKRGKNQLRKASTNHHTATTLLEVLAVEFSVWFSPGIMSYKKLYFWLSCPNNILLRVSIVQVLPDALWQTWVNILDKSRGNIYVWQTLHSTLRTSYQWSSIVVVVWWFGDALLPQDLDNLS
jgi:hypothetical protein